MCPRGIRRLLELGRFFEINPWWRIIRSYDKMHLVPRVLGHIPTKFQNDPTCNYGVIPLGHNSSTRLMSLGHKVNVHGTQLTTQGTLSALLPPSSSRTATVKWCNYNEVKQKLERLKFDQDHVTFSVDKKGFLHLKSDLQKLRTLKNAALVTGR